MVSIKRRHAIIRISAFRIGSDLQLVMEANVKILVCIAITIVLSLSSAVSAIAADDESLVQILTRADIVDNFTEYCAQFDPSIVRRTGSGIGDVRALALHIRNEVVAGLPFEEANQIILRSAQAARAAALLAVRRLYGPNPDEEHSRLTEWCQHSAEPSVQEFVNAHDQHHDQLEAFIESAKKSR